MAASNYLMELLSKHALGIEEFTMPTTFELALFLEGADSSELKDNIIDNEVDDVDYSRLDVSSELEFVDGIVRPSETLTFTSMPEVAIRFVAIINNDNIFFYAASADTIYIASGQDFIIEPEDLEISGI